MRILSGVFVLLLGCLRATGQEAEIRGDYLEDRSNHVFGCTCEFSTELANEGREAVLAWHFNSGAIDGAELGGITAVLIIEGDRMLTVAGATRKSVLVIDKDATFAQVRAVEKLIRSRYVDLAGTVAAIESAPVNFERTPDTVALRIPGQLEVRMRRARIPEDTLPASSLWYDPFISLDQPVLATRLANRYSGAALGRRWDRDEPGITGYFGTFTLSSK